MSKKHEKRKRRHEQRHSAHQNSGSSGREEQPRFRQDSYNVQQIPSRKRMDPTRKEKISILIQALKDSTNIYTNRDVGSLSVIPQIERDLNTLETEFSNPNKIPEEALAPYKLAFEQVKQTLTESGFYEELAKHEEHKERVRQSRWQDSSW